MIKRTSECTCIYCEQLKGHIENDDSDRSGDDDSKYRHGRKYIKMVKKWEKTYSTQFYESLEELYEKTKRRGFFIEQHIEYIFPYLKGNIFTKYDIEEYKLNNTVPIILGIPNTLVRKLLEKFYPVDGHYLLSSQ